MTCFAGDSRLLKDGASVGQETQVWVDTGDWPITESKRDAFCAFDLLQSGHTQRVG